MQFEHGMSDKREEKPSDPHKATDDAVSADSQKKALDVRKAMEEAHKSLSNDLRFADAKAVFIGAVIATWSNVVNSAIKLGEPKNSSAVQILIGLFLFAGCAASSFVIWAIIPKWPRKEDRFSVHQVRTLGSEYEKNEHDHARLKESIEGRFVRVDESGRSGYDASLLIDVARIGRRCTEKYDRVQAAAVAGWLSIVFGATAILINQFVNEPPKHGDMAKHAEQFVDATSHAPR